MLGWNGGLDAEERVDGVVAAAHAGWWKRFHIAGLQRVLPALIEESDAVPFSFISFIRCVVWF